MEKNKLNRFMSKYSLSGKANSVIWKIKNNKLETSFVTENKALLGKAEVDNFSFEDAEIGICILSAINVLEIQSDAEMEKVCDVIVRLLDQLIDYQDYFYQRYHKMYH